MTRMHAAHAAWLAAVVVAGPALAQPAPADAILAAYVQRAGQPASAERGKALFTRKHSGGIFDSCSDCHTANPLQRGRDQASESSMPPLAPAANPRTFTDAHRVEHKFWLNCRDVLGRECTALEKADVIAWLISLKP